MKRNIVFCSLLIAAVVISIAFCGYMVLWREYSIVLPHTYSAGADQGESARAAANYSEFKKQVITLIEKAQSPGIIRLERYTPNIEEDLARALHEIMTETPIGAYAVDMMHFDHTRVLGYYDVKVDISYKRPKEEILALRTADSADEFSSVMQDAIAERRSPCAVQCNYYTEQIINVSQTLEDLRFNRPGSVYGVRDVTVQFFPVIGVHKILLMDFDFYESPEDSKRKSAQAQETVETLIANAVGASSDERLREICAAIIADTQVDHNSKGGDPDTPYGALVEKRASAKGYAAAVKQVCSRLGTYAVVVKGEYMGQPHFWNMVYAESAWHHIDLSRGIIIAKDSEMADYSWDSSRYPTDLRKNLH